MSNTTRTTRARKTTAATPDATAPAPTPAPVQATPDATTDAPAPNQTAPEATTYTVPDTSGVTDDATRAAYVESVGTAYRNADKSLKAAIRSAWARFQSDALNGLGTDPRATDHLLIVRDVNGVLVTSRPTVEHDPADAYVIHLAALSAAMVATNEAFREAHGDDAFRAMSDRASALIAGTGGTDDERTARDALAAKLAVVKSGTRRTGPVRSVEAHIRSALDAAPAGTVLTCAQIHNHRSEAYGPDESPSVGAIGAAHGREMDGIESTTNEAKVKGFRLA